MNYEEKNKKYIVYAHLNKINKKIYYGITSKNNPISRWGKDGNGYKSQKYFYRAINKYGWDNFEHIILYEGLNEEKAKTIERALIHTRRECYGFNSCYNISNGGDTGISSLSIYCNETGEIFESLDDVISKQKHYKNTKCSDILKCCKHEKKNIPMPWINKSYHYQFLKSNIETVEELDKKYYDYIKKKEENKKTNKKIQKREKWLIECEEKYKNDKTMKQCCNCGKFFKLKYSKKDKYGNKRLIKCRKYCGMCAKKNKRNNKSE